MRRVIFFALLLLASGTAIAQQTHSREIYFTAVHADGSPIAELSPAQLKAPKEVQIYQVEKVSSAPVRFGLLLDSSGSRRQYLTAQKEMGMLLLQQLLRDGKNKAFVVNFNEEAHMDQDLTTDLNLLSKAIGRGNARGASAISDTVSVTSDHLGRYSANPPGSKVLLLVTDGKDNASRFGEPRALTMLQLNAVRVYCFRFGDRDARGKEFLADLANASGGRVFDIADGSKSAIEKNIAEIESDLENTFRVTYSNPERKSFRLESSSREIVIKSPKINN